MSEYEPAIEVDEVDEQLLNIRVTEDSVKDYLRNIGKVDLLTAEQEIILSQRIEAGLMADKILSGEYESHFDTDNEELTWLALDGQSAKHEMIEANLRLVVSLAKRYVRRSNGLELLDLIQEGNAGLVRAVEKFDYTKGFKFSTYATWWIRQAITRGIADKSRVIRLPVHINEKLIKVRMTRDDLASKSNGIDSITPADIAKAADMDVELVNELLSYEKNVTSIDTPLGNDGGTTFGDIIKDDSVITPSDAAEYVLIREMLLACIDLLPSRDADIIMRRFGFMDNKPQTLDEIGVVHGLTRERIRQLEVKAKERLERIIIDAGLREIVD